MYRLGRKAFSLVELMVSALLFSVITVSVLTIYTKLKRDEMEALVQSELRTKAKIVEKILLEDVRNAVRLSDETVEGTHYAAGPTYGLSRFPNQAVGGGTVDGLQLFVLDAENSLTSSFPVISAAPSGGGAIIQVQGDLRPVQNLTEDLIVIRKAGRTELFTISGTISVLGSGAATTSSFSTLESFPNAWLPVDTAEPPEVFRVEKRVYRIGNGSDISTGLYRVRQNLTQLVSNAVTGMQVFYRVSTDNPENSADCESVNASRYISLPADSSDCSWNEVTSLETELVFESEENIFSDTIHPHSLDESGTLKFTAKIVGTPTEFVTELLN